MSNKKVKLVVAYARNRCIGRDNQMPWHLPADLAHFKRVTLGRPVIMGRNTWESIGRPLPGRRNIIISRQSGYKAVGGEVAGSLEAALAMCEAEPEVCVIGGGQVYLQALALADEVVATEIQADIEGDAFFPELPEGWREVERLPQEAQNGYLFDFVRYCKV